MISPESILWLDSPRAQDIRLVGGKFVNLARLAGAGFSVPPAFVITTEAYRSVATGAGPISRLGESATEQSLRAGIVEAYRSFEQGDRTPVAVRSSSTAEDLEQASFAGQHETVLDVVGETALIAAIETCWASLHSDRADSYRSEHGIGSAEMGVGVQQMVAARAAGVMFTRDPAGTGVRMVVEASWGLGEAVVSGMVTPDRYVIDRDSGDTVEAAIGSKEVAIVSGEPGAGARREPVPPHMRDLPCLTVADRRTLAELGRAVEEHYGQPQDIEWAIDDDHRCFLLQARPITALPAPPSAPAKASPHDALMRSLFFDRPMTGNES